MQWMEYSAAWMSLDGNENLRQQTQSSVRFRRDFIYESSKYLGTSYKFYRVDLTQGICSRPSINSFFKDVPKFFQKLALMLMRDNFCFQETKGRGHQLQQHPACKPSIVHRRLMVLFPFTLQ